MTKKKIILGLHTGHDASACLFIDGKLAAFCKEERVTRVKNVGRYFHLKSINEVLRIAEIELDDIDAIAMTRLKLPISSFKKTDTPVKTKIKQLFASKREINIISQMLKTGIYSEQTLISTKAICKEMGFREEKPIYFTNHHLAHNLCSLKFTDWEDGLFLSCDGGGDRLQYAAYGLKNNQFKRIIGGDEETFSTGQNSAASIGLAYSYATKLAGFTPNRHEGKITGLAAFGKPELADELISKFRIENGAVLSEFSGLDELHRYLDKIFEHKDRTVIAASIQQATEQVTLKWVKNLLELFPTRHIALTGGVFSNVRLNQLIAEIEGIQEIYVFPAMTDDGLSIGCAVDAEIQSDGLEKLYRYRLEHTYYGYNYTAHDLEKAASGHSLKTISTLDAAKKAAELLKDGYVGAIFTKSMEMGPRALGARSILASPAQRDVNDSINLRLERTEFMPFAPFVLSDDAREVFEVNDANEYACRFMTITTNVNPKYHDVIPAVVHVDGTARPQIIYKEDNPLYYSILEEFKALTNIPCLVNTSFNAHEEPIINTPEEAVTALLDNRVDFLVSDDLLILNDHLERQL